MWVDFLCFADEYCTEPLSIHAGFFMCKPSQCDSFRAGTELHYVCNKNYEMRPGDQAVLTCLPGGVWSREPPVCLPGLLSVLQIICNNGYLMLNILCCINTT